MKYLRDEKGRFKKGTPQPYGFEEGHTPWNKGRAWSEETKKKISESRKRSFYVHPNLNSSPTLSYVLGVLKGDGFIARKRRGLVVGLHQEDESFAESFRNALEKLNLNPYQYSPPSTNLIRVEANSKKFCKWYKGLGSGFKEIACEHPKEFLKGFYESEGLRGESEVAFRNTNKTLLRFVGELIGNLGFDFTITQKGTWLGIRGGAKEWNDFLKEIDPVIRNERYNKEDKYDGRNNQWSEKEIEFLRENYKNLTAREISEKLNRSVRAVYTKAEVLDIQGEGK